MNSKNEVRCQILTLFSCVTLDQLLNVFELQLSYLHHREKDSLWPEVTVRIK